MVLKEEGKLPPAAYILINDIVVYQKSGLDELYRSRCLDSL